MEERAKTQLKLMIPDMKEQSKEHLLSHTKLTKDT